MSKKQPPIGFGRQAAEDENGDQPRQPEARPARQPKAVPRHVGTIEGLEILTAYGLSALAPLSNLEQHLLEVIAGLEKRIEELE